MLCFAGVAEMALVPTGTTTVPEQGTLQQDLFFAHSALYNPENRLVADTRLGGDTAGIVNLQ